MFNFIKKYNQINLFLLDQIIVSFSNFLLTIILVRSLGLVEFGVFSFFWIFLLLINSIQLSYIISPMLTNSAKKDVTSDLKTYLGSVLINQIIFSILLFLLLIIFFKFFFNLFFIYKINAFYLSFCLLVFFSQFFLFFRKIYVCRVYIKKLIIIDVIYYIFTFSLLFYFINSNNLDIQNVFLILIYANLLCTFLFYDLKKEIRFNLKSFFYSHKENWIISKWLLLTSITQWFSGNLWIINAGVILGPYYLGVIRCCQSILNVANLIFQTLENVYSVKISKIYRVNSISFLKNYINKITINGIFLVLIISLLISFFAEFLLNLIFGSEISSQYYVLIYLSFLLPLTFMQYFPQHALRAFSKTFSIFAAFFCSSIIAILFSSLIIKEFKIYGFVSGMYVSQLIILIIIYHNYFKEVNKS